MSALDLIGLVVVLLVAAAVVLLVVRRRSRSRSAAARGPRTVADLVRMRAEESAAAAGSGASAPSGPEQPAETAAQAEAASQSTPAPAEAATARASEPAAQPPAAAAGPAPVSVPEQSTSERRPAPQRVPPPAAVPAKADRTREVAPVPVIAAVEKPLRAPGPDTAGADTPWHRAELMAAGDGGAGTWQPPAPVAPVPAVAEPTPLRLVPGVQNKAAGPDADPDPDPDPDEDPTPGPSTWTGWADWEEVDAEEAEDAVARADRRREPARAPSGSTSEQGGERSSEPDEPDEPDEADPPSAALPESPKILLTRVAVPTPDADPEVEPVARPLGKRTPEERAAEQAAADIGLLRTFGYADASTRPDTAPVVAMVRADLPEAATVDKGAAQPVRFHVVGRDGAPVAGAAVTLLDDCGLEVADAAADADGRGEVLAPAAGTFALVATARRHQPNVVAVTVAEEPVDAVALLARSASVGGSVQGEDGPIAGARVTLVQDGEMVEAVTTDVGGAYRIEDIASGEYGLSVAAAGCVPVVAIVAVPDGAELRRDVVLDPASPTAEHGSDGYDDGFDGVDGMMSGQRYS